MVLRVLGVPSAAGAHGHGVARAPAALRAAGLLEALRSRGLDVADAGDLPLVPFTPDPTSPRAQLVEQVVAVARDVADRVATISGAGDVPLVLGGNCTITLGVIAGLCARYPRLGLACLDGDADMSAPVRSVSGILDAMGIAAMLGLEGADPAFASMSTSSTRPICRWPSSSISTRASRWRTRSRHWPSSRVRRTSSRSSSPR